MGPELKENGYHKHQQLSTETVIKMEDAFTDSWYCRTFQKQDILPLPDIAKYYDDRITDYIKAAICDWLIGRGCEVSK
jgi:hypothetical protein